MNIFGDDKTFLSVIPEPIPENELSTTEGAESAPLESAPSESAPLDADVLPFGDESSFRCTLAEQDSATQHTSPDAEVQSILQTIDDFTRIDTDTFESELPPAFPEDGDNVQIADELDDIFESLNQAFVKVNAADCGKMRIGNDYGAFEIDRKCGAPYARFCPCPPEKKPQCNCGKGAGFQKNEQGKKAGSDLSDLTDLFSWYWTAKDKGGCNNPHCGNNGNCNNNNIHNGCPFDNSQNCGECKPQNGCEEPFNKQCGCGENFMHCNNPDAWAPQNNCPPPPKQPAKPCGKRLSRNIYYRLLQITQAVSFLVDCAPNSQSQQTLCCVKQNLSTLSLAMFATSKRICGARPIVMNTFEKPNCPFERGVNAVICELSSILKDIQLLQTLPSAQCAYGALVVIAFGVNRVLSMMYTL